MMTLVIVKEHLTVYIGTYTELQTKKFHCIRHLISYENVKYL